MCISTCFNFAHNRLKFNVHTLFFPPHNQESKQGCVRQHQQTTLSNGAVKTPTGWAAGEIRRQWKLSYRILPGRNCCSYLEVFHRPIGMDLWSATLPTPGAVIFWGESWEIRCREMWDLNTWIPRGFTGEEENHTNDLLSRGERTEPCCVCLDVCSVDLQYHRSTAQRHAAERPTCLHRIQMQQHLNRNQTHFYTWMRPDSDLTSVEIKCFPPPLLLLTRSCYDCNVLHFRGGGVGVWEGGRVKIVYQN